jgi:CheY-like chemotaxis protein
LAHYILVVDDDHALRESICEALEMEGYDTVCVEHGEAAMRHLEKAEPPCLILLDLMMPVMDGQTFRQLMLSRPSLAGIPVVVLTAGGRQMAASVPATDVLLKPLRIGTVIDVVKVHCPEARA